MTKIEKDINLIDKIVEKNKGYDNLNNNNIVRSLRNILKSGKDLTTPQRKAVRNLDVAGKWEKACKKH